MKTNSNRWIFRIGLVLALWAGFLPPLQAADTTAGDAPGDGAVVRALLFFSPTCPHCHDVIEDTLKPLLKQYGEQLLIITVNVREPDGQALYIKAIEWYAIPEDRKGVPTLIVGDQVLVGGAQIPAEFPAMVKRLLASGGIALPDLPGLVLPQEMGEGGITTDTATKGPANGPFAMLSRDPLGNGLAIAMLLLMLFVLIQTLLSAPRYLDQAAPSARLGWPVPLIGLLGLGVAGYMAYVETAQVLAVCGPVGDCNTVQQSDYAKLFGIPLGVLGLGGYMLVLGAWLTARLAPPRSAALGVLACFALAFGGTLFSAYLTFLEPFVIGATCAWCLASALCMTLLLIATRKSAGAAWRVLREVD